MHLLLFLTWHKKRTTWTFRERLISLGVVHFPWCTLKHLGLFFFWVRALIVMDCFVLMSSHRAVVERKVSITHSWHINPTFINVAHQSTDCTHNSCTQNINSIGFSETSMKHNLSALIFINFDYCSALHSRALKEEHASLSLLQSNEINTSRANGVTFRGEKWIRALTWCLLRNSTLFWLKSSHPHL